MLALVVRSIDVRSKPIGPVSANAPPADGAFFLPLASHHARAGLAAANERPRGRWANPMPVRCRAVN